MAQSGVQAISADAQRNGVIAAVATGFISSGAVYLAQSMSPRFRTSLSISGKVALIMIPSSGAFFLNSLQTVAEAHKDPEGYMTRRDSGKALRAPAAPQERLALWQSAANTVFNHPFKTIFSIFTPAYAFIFYKESTAETTKNLLLSQRLIHTRVYGQMVAVLSTVSVMGFVKTMESDGGAYRLVDGRVVRGNRTSSHSAGIYRQMYEAPKITGLAGVGGAAGADAVAREQRRAAEEAQIAAEFENSQMSGLNMLVPLLYAPLLPLLRLGLRNRVPPERLTHITLGVVGVALVHAGTIMFGDSSVAMRK